MTQTGEICDIVEQFDEATPAGPSKFRSTKTYNVGKKVVAVAAASVFLMGNTKSCGKFDGSILDAKPDHAAGSCDYVPHNLHDTASTSTKKAMKIGKLMNKHCFGNDEWPALKQLWAHESSWDPNAENPGSGACSVAQADPCSKMDAQIPGELQDTTEGQIYWGLNYIQVRYGTPTEAWQVWNDHCATSKWHCWY